MSFDAPAEAFNCFLSYPTIARWAGVSLASVKRALQKHIDGPAPLLARSKPGHTRGYPTRATGSRWCGRPSIGAGARRRAGIADSNRWTVSYAISSQSASRCSGSATISAAR